jgi:glycosyltransferase involved in cell wall biosynthesis
MSGSPPLPVVQVVPYYPPHLGGMENVARILAELFAETRDVEVLTTTIGASGSPRRERYGRLVIHRHRAVEFAHIPFSPGLLVRLLLLPRDVVVHMHGDQAVIPEMVWLSSILTGRPFIAHYHGDTAESGTFGVVYRAYKRYVFGRTLRAARCVLALTEEQRQFVVREYGVAPTSTRVVPNGVEPARYPGGPSKASHEGPLRLLFVGRLSPQKNIPRLIQALALIRTKVEVVIVGDGVERPKIERLARELGLCDLRLVGEQHGHVLVEWYRWADAFVLPSNEEGMPLVLLEAMAAGLPIIATDVPGTRELAEGGAMLLSAPEPAALAQAIERIATDSQLRGTLGRAGYDRAHHFDWGHVLLGLEDVYSKVAAAGRA